MYAQNIADSLSLVSLQWFVVEDGLNVLECCVRVCVCVCVLCVCVCVCVCCTCVCVCVCVCTMMSGWKAKKI